MWRRFKFQNIFWLVKYQTYRFPLFKLVVSLPALVHQLHVASLVRVGGVHLLVLQKGNWKGPIYLGEERWIKTGFSPPCRGWRCPQVYRPFELQAHGATCANSPKAWNRGMQNKLYIEKSIIIQGNKVKANSAHLLLILSTYSPVFWLAMLLGAMCSLKSGPKYSK